jgi:hypothetical protein
MSRAHSGPVKQLQMFETDWLARAGANWMKRPTHPLSVVCQRNGVIRPHFSTRVLHLTTIRSTH